MNISIINLIIVIAFLAGTTLIGVLQIRNKRDTSNGIFLADRNLKWALIGLSLFAANISTIHIVGLASCRFNEGMGVVIFGSVALTVAGLMKLGVFMDESGISGSLIGNQD